MNPTHKILITLGGLALAPILYIPYYYYIKYPKIPFDFQKSITIPEEDVKSYNIRHHGNIFMKEWELMKKNQNELKVFIESIPEESEQYFKIIEKFV